MRQDLRNQRGEIEFRRNLFRQQVEGEAVFTDELDAEEIETVLRERMAATLSRMTELRARGARFSPYLEIGAERGQRALVMENKLGAEGAALDLSLDLLRSCAHYAAKFGMERLPRRLCADAYTLPFRTGSLPFVFCYQTLHHFPDPDPIVAEIHRVLAPGGHFFFAEEPFRRVLHWGVVKAKGGPRRQRRSRIRRLLAAVFVEERFNEEEFGVLENPGIPLSRWKETLERFERGDATLTLDGHSTSAFASRNPVLFTVMYLLGGQISGLYRKAGAIGDCARSIDEALVSPVHLAAGAEVPLTRMDHDLYGAGPERYPVVDGIAMLLPPQMLHDLYPELVTS